jgi:sensor histidine kinase regulating citrate/malate metabolism
MKLPTTLRLHHQLVLVVSGLLLVAIALLGGYTAWAQHQSARQALQVQAATLARFMALSSGNLILTESLDQVESLALRIVDLPDVMAIRVVDAQGQSLCHVQHMAHGAHQVVFDAPSLRLKLPDKPQPLEVMDADHPDQLVVWHPVMAGTLVGWVQVGATRAG